MPGEPPKVTGLSPNEGPPGTKITIRGENLGISQQDIVGLTICGVDCLMYAEWKSPSKIIARCGAGSAAVRGDVTVTTRSGGRGTSTVQFWCFLEPIDLTKESAVWVDESHMFSVSYGRNRPTSPSQIHPDDPLRVSDEGNITRFPEEELHEMFPGGSGNLLSENFVPAWYLLDNHHGASFDTLQAGLACLRSEVSQRKEGPIAFLKSNVLSIVDCLDVLVSLQSAMEKDKQEAGNDLTEKLEGEIIKSKQEADSLFQDVLARKDKADSTRNALGVLQRFRFLFNLPASIERNIQKGDYDVVINDYARAKLLFHATEVAVFKKVYQEVEQRIQKFRDMLAGKLKQLPCNIDEQKRLIRYLVNLEAPGDPAWESIYHITNWLTNSMNSCRNGYLEAVTESTVDEKTIPDGMNWESETPQVVLFVEDVTKFYSEHFPDLWKLGQAYLNGQLHTRELQEQSYVQNTDKQIAFKTMVMDVTNRLCNLLRAALLSHTLHVLHFQKVSNPGCWPKSQTGDALGGWLPLCIRSIRQCYTSLVKLELPDDILNVVQQLIFDLRVFSMTTLFNQASEDVRSLHFQETWDVEIDDQNGATTQLPLLFENIVVEILQRIRETVLQCGPRETEVFSQINVQATIKQLSQTLLQAFVIALEKMAFSSSTANTTDSKTLFIISDALNSDNYQDITTSGDKRLLVVLSNCTYTTQIIIPRLQDSFHKYGYPDMSLVVKCSQAKYRELESKLFQKYLDRKCDPIKRAIEPKMYANNFDWKNCPRPTGISNYVQDIIMNMIIVHAEVFSVSPPFVEKVLTRIVEAVAEMLSRLFQTVGIFLQNGNIQATLDTKALEETLRDYQTYNSGKSFKICRDHLTGIGDSKDKLLIEDLLKKFKTQMQMQLLCFAKEKIVSV